MALFSSSVGTLCLLLPKLPLPFLWRAVAALMVPAEAAWRISLVKASSSTCVEGKFCELRRDGVLRSSGSGLVPMSLAATDRLGARDQGAQPHPSRRVPCDNVAEVVHA